MAGDCQSTDVTGEITAVTFDLDDTLCVYRRDGSEVLAAAFERAGVDPLFTAADYYDRYRDYLEASADIEDLRSECFADLVAERGGDPAVGRAVAEAYAAERDQRAVDPLPGAHATIDALADRYRLALVTNGAREMQRSKLAGAGLENAFDVEIFAGDETAPKPDPEPFELAVSELDATPAETVHVGNSLETDVGGALRAGLGAVWIPADESPAGAPEPEPTFVLDSLAALETPPWERADPTPR